MKSFIHEKIPYITLCLWHLEASENCARIQGMWLCPRCAKLFPLIFLANILCVHVRKSDEMYGSSTCCTHAKKKTTRPMSRILLYAAEPSSARGPPFVLAKRDHLISSPFFCKRNAFWKVGMARSWLSSITLFEGPSFLGLLTICIFPIEQCALVL